MKTPDPERPLTRGEKETETEAGRLVEFIEQALGLVAVRLHTDVDSLDTIADRIERSARNLSVALRELAEERRAANAESDRLAS